MTDQKIGKVAVVGDVGSWQGNGMRERVAAAAAETQAMASVHLWLGGTTIRLTHWTSPQSVNST